MSATVQTATAALEPGPTATLFLRACLIGGAPGRRAWERWIASVADPAAAFRARGELRRLGPLLDHGLRAAGVDATGSVLRTALRASAVRGQRRTEAFARDAGAALDALREAGADPTVLRGAALADLAYPQPWLRHCHDLDLLVQRDLTARARAALVPDGRGAPVALHAHALRVPGAHAPAELLVRRAERRIAGAAARVPAPDDALLLVCAHGLAGPVPGRLSWAPDAWFTLQAEPGMDWDRLRASASETRLTVVLAIALKYLQHQLEAAIPDDQLVCLREAARASGSADRGVALAAAWRARGRGRRFGQVRA